MRRKALYSRAAPGRRRAFSAAAGVPPGDQQLPVWAGEADHGPSAVSIAWGGLQRFAARHERLLMIASSVLLSLAFIGGYSLLQPAQHTLTQHDIDGAVQYSLAHRPPAPAVTARAAAIIAPAVVEVQGFLSPEHLARLRALSPHKRRTERKRRALPARPLAPSSPNEPQPDAIGSGVVVTANGEVLTALHVVASTDRWVVVFADGSKSKANLVGADPQNDLAVLQPRRMPQGLKPAALASLAGLRPGDQVVATGFPFGIGPSVSAGVVSGLGREFVDPDNPHVTLKHLIQFDAAVNPGNSGGPLVNRDGEVVGIVSAIANPSGARVFAGIGFAVPIQNAMRAVGNNPL